MRKRKWIWGAGIVLVLLVGFVIYWMFFSYEHWTVSSDEHILQGEGHTYLNVDIANQDPSTIDRFAFAKTQDGDEIVHVKGHPNEVILIQNTDMGGWFLFKETN